MTLISRRKTIKYLAALPIASALSCRSWLPKKNTLTTKAGASPGKWNILLHGQLVVQWVSPADPSLMRLIFPTVNAPGHKHEYWIGDFGPGNQGYALTFKTTSALKQPDPATNIVLLANQLNIPTADAAIKAVAQCWLDLPRPSDIHACRPRATGAGGCGITFSGTVGQTVKAEILPTITLLVYDLDANPNLQTTIPTGQPQPTLGKNLVIRSEPRKQPDDGGCEALRALLNCMGIDGTKFDTSGDCCPPAIDPAENKKYGVSDQDVSSLQEISGEKCSPPPPRSCAVPGTVGIESLQVRACMTTIAT